MSDATQSTVLSSAPRKKGTIRLLKESYDIFDHNLLALAKTVVVVVLPLIVFYWFLTSVVLPQEFMNRVVTLQHAAIAQFMLVVLVAAFLTASLVGLYHIALFSILQVAEEGRKLGTFAAYRKAWAQLPAYSAVSSLVGLKLALWSLLFVIPGLIFGLWYSLSNTIFLIDGKKGEAALIESKRIMKSCMGTALWNMAVMLAVVAFAWVLADVLLANTFGVNEPGAPYSVLADIGMCIFGVFIIALSVYPFIFIYCLYGELKRMAGPAA